MPEDTTTRADNLSRTRWLWIATLAMLVAIAGTATSCSFSVGSLCFA